MSQHRISRFWSDRANPGNRRFERIFHRPGFYGRKDYSIFPNGVDRNRDCRVDFPQENRHSTHSESSQYLGKCLSWLPNRNVVEAIEAAVFPTSRYKANHKRFSHIGKDGVAVGMYDENPTPEWALFWSHGLEGTRPQGGTVSHVWPTSSDVDCYTHVANLALVPEPFANLTDKNGPLTAFLRWHA